MVGPPSDHGRGSRVGDRLIQGVVRAGAQLSSRGVALIGCQLVLSQNPMSEQTMLQGTIGW